MLIYQTSTRVHRAEFGSPAEWCTAGLAVVPAGALEELADELCRRNGSNEPERRVTNRVHDWMVQVFQVPDAVEPPRLGDKELMASFCDYLQTCPNTTRTLLGGDRLAATPWYASLIQARRVWIDRWMANHADKTRDAAASEWMTSNARLAVLARRHRGVSDDDQRRVPCTMQFPTLAALTEHVKNHGCGEGRTSAANQSVARYQSPTLNRITGGHPIGVFLQDESQDLPVPAGKGKSNMLHKIITDALTAELDSRPRTFIPRQNQEPTTDVTTVYDGLHRYERTPEGRWAPPAGEGTGTGWKWQDIPAPLVVDATRPHRGDQANGIRMHDRTTDTAWTAHTPDEAHRLLEAMLDVVQRRKATTARWSPTEPGPALLLIYNTDDLPDDRWITDRDGDPGE